MKSLISCMTSPPELRELWYKHSEMSNLPKHNVLHYLPVQQRIFYRISSIVWHCVLGNAPSYLLELFILTSACSGRRSLRSATKGDFLVPRARNCHQTEKGFLDCGSLCLEWSSL